MNLTFAISLSILEGLSGSKFINKLLGLIQSPSFDFRQFFTQVSYLKRCLDRIA